MKNLITHIKDKESIQLINDITEEFYKKLARPLRIGVLGERNSGKSTLINHLCRATICETSRFEPTLSNQSILADFGKMKIEFIDTFYSLCDLANLENEKNIELISSFDLILFLSKADQKYFIEKYFTEENILWQKLRKLCKKNNILVLLSKIDHVTSFKNALPSEPDLFLNTNYVDAFSSLESCYIIPICCNPDYNFDELLKYIIEKLDILESSIRNNRSYTKLSHQLTAKYMKIHFDYIRKEKGSILEEINALLRK